MAVNEAAGRHWDEQLEKLRSRTVTRVRWWEDATTKRHINAIIGNPNLTEVHAAFHERIAQFFQGRTNLKAVSVGCGVGTKELWLMQMIDIARFDLYDVSPSNIALGIEQAALQGASKRANLQVADAFAADLGCDYDLVYWNNSLHHMPNVVDSVRWSHERLKLGGLFAMDDFIGPDRFQWTDENLRWGTEVLQNLPDRFLRNPWAPGRLISRQCVRPTVEEVVSADPSEAVDSSRIVSAIRTTFPQSEIIPTGGALYHLALNDIFCNFETADDLLLLKQILIMDQLLAAHGTSQYAVAYAVKA